jgi:hypothetical protein
MSMGLELSLRLGPSWLLVGGAGISLMGSFGNIYEREYCTASGDPFGNIVSCMVEQGLLIWCHLRRDTLTDYDELCCL